MLANIIALILIVLLAFAVLAWLLDRTERVTVPVTVDAVRAIDGVEMVRATYFVVASDTPSQGWLLRRVRGLPLRVLGQVGVVYQPGRWRRRFADADDLTRLIRDVEANEALSIETEDLWLPVAWLETGRKPERNDVYR